MQYDLTQQRPLLDEQGLPVQNGLLAKPLPEYRRADVRAKRGMIREKECWFIGNRRFSVLLSISASGRHTVDAITLVDFEAERAEWKIKRRWYSEKNVTIAESAEHGDTSSFGKHHSLYFKNDHGVRTLVAQIERFGEEGSLYIRAEISEAPEDVLASVSAIDGGFRFAQHHNWLRVKGQICYGREVFELDPAETFATLTWERGAWKPYSTGWVCSGSGVTDAGLPFGLHLTSQAIGGVQENMAFIDGTGYPLSALTFELPPKWNDMESWTIANEQLKLEFIPLLTLTDKSKVRRVYGRFTGSVTLDSGETHAFVNLIGFAEQTDKKE